jgi:hypothetical protein
MLIKGSTPLTGPPEAITVKMAFGIFLRYLGRRNAHPRRAMSVSGLAILATELLEDFQQ